LGAVFVDDSCVRTDLEGEPIAFEVPPMREPLLSAMRLGSELLVIRSDFDGTREPVTMEWEARTIAVPLHRGAEVLRMLPASNGLDSPLDQNIVFMSRWEEGADFLS